MNTNTSKQSNEQRYYDILKRIAKSYASPERLKRDSEKRYGCSGEEAIEMAYENIQWEAEAAIKGRRRPKQ